jgi:hypothetical protein
VDMTKYAGSESKYLKAADLQGKQVKVTISGVSLLEFEDDNGTKSTKPALSMLNKEKQVVCNATAISELIQAFGANSDAWIGKEIRLSTKHYPKFGRDGIVITPIAVESDNDSIPF